MSQNPRRVLTDCYVQWGEAGTPPLFVRHGTVADILPGSALEAAYGGSGNLSAVIPVSQGDDLGRAPQHN